MQRLRLLTLASLAVLSSCKPPDAALRVNVSVRAAGMARVRADCLRLTISDDTQELKSLTIKRPADDSAVFGVLRGTDLPATLKVQASGYIGSNCSDDATLKLNAQGEVVTGVFPESGVTELSVFVDPPNSTLDGDRDGFVGAMRGGSDCKDDDSSIFPGANQICANTVDTDCDGAGGCDDSECGTAVVCADPPDRVRITTTVTTMLRHECRGPFKVELYNTSGVRRAIRDTTVALSASLPGVTVHGTATCTEAAVASVLIPYDASSFDEVYLKTDGAAFGITTLTATASAVPTPGTTMVEVHPQPVDRLEFTSPPRTVSAGSCGAEPITLELRDAQNRRTDVDAPATVTLTSNPGDVNPNIFFSDAACGTPGDMQMLMPGQGTITVYVLASRAGSFQLTANVGVGANPTQPLTVQPAVPSKLAFTNGPLVLSTTQSCSAGLFTVQLQDRFDNPVNAAADVGVRMSVSGLVGVALYEPTGGCQNAAQTDFTIPAGSSSVSLRAKGMTAAAQPGEIRANALTGGGTIADAVQPLRISAGVASKFVMTGGAQSPLASVCSANPFSIDLQDSAGNPASLSGPVTFALSTVPASTDSTFEFYGGAGCQTDLNGMLTVPAGQTSATFYYRGNRAVTLFEIRAMSTLTAPSTFLPGNSIRPGPPGKLVFVAPLAQTAQSGSCTPGPYLANVLDLFDNQTSFTTAQTVTVGSNPAGVTVGSSACATGNMVQLAAGANQVSFTAQHTVTSPTTPYALTASVNGFSTTTPVTLNVTPGPSTLIVDTPAGATSTLMAGACQQITLSRRDGNNNNAPTSGVTPVTLTFPGSTTWLVYASNNCSGSPGAMPTMNSTHTVTFSVRPQTAGSHQVTASINSGGPQSAPINFQVSAGAPTLVFTTPSTGTPGLGNASASAVAGTCMPITVRRKDSFNNDVPLGSAANVTFTVAGGTTIHSGTPCLPGNAINTTTGIPLTPTDASASFYVYATRSLASGGPQLQNVVISLAAQTANLALTVSPAAATVSTVITLPVGGTASLLAHQCQRVNVERRDAFMNLVPAAGSNLTVTPAAGDMQTFTSVDCTGTANTTIPVTAGASTRDFSLRLDTAGAAPRALTVTVETVPAPLSLTISPAATTLFQVQGLPATMISGACVGPLTLRRRDGYNNDTTNGTISVPLTSTGTSPLTFSTAADCSGATAGLSVGINDLSSVSTQFYLTATVAAAASFTATLGGASGMGTLTVNPAPPSEIIFTTPVRSFTASVCGGAGNVISVQLRDPAGNPSNASGGGQAFTAVSTSGGASWFTNASCSTAAAGGNFTIPAGTNTLSLYYRDTAIGTPTISLTNGSSLTNPTPQLHSVVVGPAARLAYTTPVRTFTAAQCPGAANVITVQLQDANGNPVNAGVGGQAFTAVSNSTGTVSWFTDDACVASTLGGFTIPAGSNSVNVFYQDTRAATPTITLTNASSLSNPTGQVHTVNVGAPARLAFTSTPQTIAALSCSAATVVTLQDAGGNTVNAGMNRQIAFSATPGAATTTFYSNASCSTALTGDEIQMNSGNSSVTIYFRAENAGAITLAADTASILQGTQGATITLAPPTQLSITTVPPATQEAGFCLPVAVERLESLNRPSTIGSATVITPSFAPTTGASLFSDVNCTAAIAGTFSIASGASTTTVYVKGINGSVSGIVPGNQAYTFTMTSGAMTDNVVVTVQPMVRRRNAACTLGTDTISCPITPTLADISRTILFFQATPAGGDDNPSNDNVSCRLDPNGGVAQVVCNRDGTADNVSIEWQTVSFAYSYLNGGVTVQQVTASCVAAATNAMPINVTTSAPRANSFVLFSNRGPGAANDNDADNFFTAQLTTDTNLQFRQSAGGTTCTRSVDFDAQVVSWANAAVTRNITAGGSTTTPFTVGSLSLTPASTFLLYSSRMAATGDLGGNNNICRRRLRGEITSASQLNFHRGCSGADIQDISWEAVQVPAGRGSVQQVRGTTVSGQAATPALSFTCADLSRCVLFMGGQGPGGSATGSTTFATDDRVGAALARPVITSTTAATYTRGVNNDVGDFTGFLLQLNP